MAGPDKSLRHEYLHTAPTSVICKRELKKQLLAYCPPNHMVRQFLSFAEGKARLGESAMDWEKDTVGFEVIL